MKKNSKSRKKELQRTQKSSQSFAKNVERDKEKIKEELKKLKVRIPEVKKPEKKEELKQDENSLEEQIEETEDIIEDTEFHEFFRPSERSFTSLLNKIETPSENLEQNVATTPIKEEEKTSNPIMTYSQSQDYSQGEAKKYQTETSVSLRRVETSRQQNLQRQELRNQFEAPRNNAWNPWNEQIEAQVIEENRNLPFERENKKYKEFKIH